MALTTTTYRGLVPNFGIPKNISSTNISETTPQRAKPSSFNSTVFRSQNPTSFSPKVVEPTTQLQRGDTGSSVRQLQDYLVSKGLMTQDEMNTGPGIYGPRTASAVSRLQQQDNVDTSGGGVGRYGPRTISSLDGSYTAPKPYTSSPKLYTPPTTGLIQPRNLGTPTPITAPTQTTPAPTQTAPTQTAPVTASSPTNMSGLVTNALNQARGYYNQQQGLTTQAQDVAKRIGEQQANITGQYQGTASDEAGRLAQLEQIKQSTLANIGQQEAKLSGYEAPLASLYGTSIGAAKPTGAFPFVFNPLTGKFDTAGTGASTGTNSPTLTYNPSQDAQTLAEDVINGTIPFKDAQSAMGYAGSIGPGLLQTAITDKGGNVTQLEAQANATQSIVNTQNTAQANTLSKIYGANADKAYTLNNSLNNIESLGKLTLNTEKGGAINPLTVQALNSTIADLRNELSSPSQAAFNSNMANFQSALSSIYANSSGAIPTQITKWGTAIANGTMPLATLQAVYKQAINEGNLRLNNLKNTANTAYGQLQGSTGTQGTQTSTSADFSNSNFFGQ